MNKIAKCLVKCGHCQLEQAAGIQFGSEEAFMSSATSGNKQQCIGCGRMFAVNKENMRYRSETGGFVGDDFAGNKV